MPSSESISIRILGNFSLEIPIFHTLTLVGLIPSVLEDIFLTVVISFEVQ